MRSFEDLVGEAEAADVDGWGFLDGRATEERPPWGYARLMGERLATVASAVDLDTGGGEVLSEAPSLPRRMVATESWPPNVERARKRLPGVPVVETGTLEDNSFELVTSRHPVVPDWSEIHRILLPDGSYLAQHVGPASAFDLIEEFLGPLPDERKLRDPHDEVEEAGRAGLEVVDLRTASCRMEFHDIGAVVWILRKCVWWVPDFSVDRYRDTLLELDRRMRGGHPFVTYSTRHLIEARKP